MCDERHSELMKIVKPLFAALKKRSSKEEKYQKKSTFSRTFEILGCIVERNNIRVHYLYRTSEVRRIYIHRWCLMLYCRHCVSFARRICKAAPGQHSDKIGCDSSYNSLFAVCFRWESGELSDIVYARWLRSSTAGEWRVLKPKLSYCNERWSTSTSTN